MCLYVDYFHSLFDARFSTNNPEKKAKEEVAFVYFMDFVEECEGMYMPALCVWVV